MLLNFDTLRENKTHGSSTLPYRVYTEPVVYNEFSTNLHWHDEMEFVFVEAGSLIYYANNQQVTVPEGSYIFVKTGALHGFQGISENDAMCRVILFSLSFLYSFSQDSCQIDYLSPLSKSKIEVIGTVLPQDAGYESIHTAFQAMIKNEDNPSVGYELITKSCLLQIIAALYKNNYIFMGNKTLYVQQNYCDNIKKALQYIYENYSSPISVETLAKHSNLSRYHFLHTFKSVTGMTCINYINMFRLEKAEKLLINTNHTITEVALETGFENISYFIKLFRNRYLVTPLQYKKSHQNA